MNENGMRNPAAGKEKAAVRDKAPGGEKAAPRPLTGLSCEAFVARLGSDAPVPGGGSASGLVAAIGVALGNMVGHLTVGKKKYADVEGEMRDLMARCDLLQSKMLDMAEQDAEAFKPLSAAYRMPANTPEEAARKEAAMQAALSDAALAPLEILQGCREAIDLCRDFAHKGTRLAVSDAGAGVLFCKAAMQGAALNVSINTAAMKDRALAEKLDRETAAILAEYGQKADEVYEYVKGCLG